MRRTILSVLVTVSSLGASMALAADPPVLVNWPDMKWTEVAEPAGAREALLWGDPKAGAYGTLLRWKFGSKAAPAARSQEAHFFVLAGTFTLDTEGVGYREFGPGGYARIPKGVKYTAGCEAAGECRFLLHQGGPADTVK